MQNFLASLSHALSQSDLVPPESVSERPFETRQRQVVEQIFWLRAFGLGIGFICVGGVLASNGASRLLWLLAVLNCYAWPWFARHLALQAAAPLRAERRNQLFDAALGGIWIALLQFNLLPCVVTVAMLAMNNVCIGGARLLLRALIVQAASCLLCTALCGFHFRPQTTMLEIVATLPVLLAYPIAIGTAAYCLARATARQNRRLTELACVDSLTGLFNRGTWERFAVRELSRHLRGGPTATLLMIDIDHFKTINDKFGHPAGDDAIRALATVIRCNIRDIDLAGRYGGDEFSVILVNADADSAARVAERIRRGVRDLCPQGLGDATLSVSIGIAATSTGTFDARSWIGRADAALREAKRQGRDGIAVDA